MAARKLQTEIDRTLKKVAEGVELFESIYEKMQNTSNQTQKEKLELDLKTQIKKLQRLRDQIKTWVASNEIKDKSNLLDNRKLIETQMEKFKACEKEMKTKAFSKEGLIQAAKLDPKEQEKEEAMSWLQSQVESLQLQVEQAEAEIESLQGNAKKRGKFGTTSSGRLETLEHLNDRRKWHINRLEIVARLLNNGSLTAERVRALKEDVSYFVESNTEEDFDEDEGIYDDLNLDEEEEKFGPPADDDNSEESDLGSEDMPPRTPKKYDEENPSGGKHNDSPILKKAPVTLQLRKTSIASETKPPPNPNFAQQPMSSILKAGLPPVSRPPASLPPIRYAAAAAAAVAPQTPSAVQPLPTPVAPVSSATLPQAPLTSSSIPISQSTSQDPAQSSPSLTHPSVTSPVLSSSASVSQQPDESLYSGVDSPAMSEAVPSSHGGPMAESPESRKGSVSSPPREAIQSPVASQLPPQDQPTQSQANGSSQAAPMALSGPSPLPQQVQQYPLTTQQLPLQFPPGVKVEQLQSQPSQPSQVMPPTQQTVGAQRTSTEQTRPGAFPGSLSDLVMSFETVKQKATHRMNNLDQVHKLLEGGYSNIPQPQDTERPKYYIPRNPYQTPPYYPQTPLPVLNTAAIFSQLDVETLFYVFYFLPGTYQQYLAAKELKKQSWRFHVKYLTWFQRHSEPQAITEEYEQGVYVYFDWEGSWCQRKKSDFRFEYRYLSED